MARQGILFALMVISMCVRRIEPSKETLETLTTAFFKSLDECKKELNFPDNIMVDLYNYWKEEYELLHRDVGCAIVCMSKKLNVLDAEGRLHHTNAEAFAKQHGANEDLASKLVGIVHGCEKQFETIGDDCERILEIAKCFRSAIHKLEWAPSMDVIVTELMKEM